MSTREVHINDPNDGEWVMLRVGGLYNAKTDHVIALRRDGRTVGGVVFTGYLQASICMHMAGSEDNWCTRDFLWMVFDYVFIQLGVRKAIGLVPSTNHRALAIDTRLGFEIEASIKDACLDGADLLVLSMTKERCKWLNLKPRYYRSGQSMEADHGRR